MLIREYQPSDAEILAAIYRDAVIGIGATAYNAKQIEVWSSFPEDLEEFRHLLSQGLTIVALDKGQLVAFGQLNPLDRIAFIYTATRVARKGFATKIYQQLEDYAIAQLEDYAIAQNVQRLHTEASHISKHFFLKMGFSVVEMEIVDRKNTQFERFKMEKIILPSASRL
ncbi:GNAT family N-acetyltransferase [Phormidium sp. LEGE 05292]|uniref:GNAT family N-acetyltransferase n=1 Tax=[Phormidium] sp. LEGE 05292 TaxID=767427 RepID=UPI001880C8C5|nr:GNAT family N-acetyltransferase [Phormidium sp. LEGE 05292]MBE9227179.1 GNAT family N-acetyltransferase [Phormidium sp. LEGE 05292]